MSTAPNPNIHGGVRLTKFFLVVSIFLIVISILAIYSTVTATEYGAKKDDMQSASLTHLLKSIYWLNNFDRTLDAGIRLNITLQNVNSNHTNNNIPTSIVNSSAANKQSIYNPLTKYKSYISKLHADRTVEGSLANLRYNAEVENSTYEKSLITISETSKFITIMSL